MQALVEEELVNLYPRVAKVLKGESRRSTGFSNAEVKLLWEHGRVARSHSGNLWSDGVKLYSYSTPIAVRCRNGLLVNTHFYSVTTSCHRPSVAGAVGVDFELLRSWVPLSELEKLYILDCDRDAILLFKNGGDDLYILVLREGRNEYGVRLPKPCRSVAGAKRMLLPKEVQQAVKEGREVKRQGEWYFIPFPEMQFPRDAVEHPLRRYRRWRREDRHLGRHIARDKVTWAFSIEEASSSAYFEHSRVYVFVRGTVRHSRRDHKLLRLGEVWHLAVRSPLRGRTASGGLD